MGSCQRDVGDKCYGSTAGSNPASVGSTPTSLANGSLAQLDRALDYESRG